MIDVEQRLRDSLQAVAAATTSHDRLGELVQLRGRRHRGALMAAAAFIATVVVIGGIANVFDDSDPSVTSNAPFVEQPTTTSASVSPAATEPDGTPSWRLVVDTDALDFEVITEGAWENFDTVAGTGERRLQTYRRSSYDFEGPSFWVDTDFDGTDFFRGGYASTGGEQLRFGGHDGFLLNDPMRFAFEDGEWDVVVTAIGATQAELKSFAAGLERTGDAWEATVLPGGLSLVSSGGGDPEFPLGSANAEYEIATDGGTSQISVSVGGGDAQVLERHVYDRIVQPGSEPTVAHVGDSDVILGAADEWATAVWLDGDRIADLHVTGGIDVLDVLPHVIVPDDDQWDAMSSRSDAELIQTQLGRGQIDIESVPDFIGRTASDVTELAWSDVPGVGRLSLYRWTEDVAGDALTCFGSGGSVCFPPDASFVPDSAVFPWGIGSSASCVAPTSVTIGAWGLAPGVRSLIVGTGPDTITIEARGGYAVGGWDSVARPNPIGVGYSDGTVQWFEPFRSVSDQCPSPDDGPG